MLLDSAWLGLPILPLSVCGWDKSLTIMPYSENGQNCIWEDEMK